MKQKFFLLFIGLINLILPLHCDADTTGISFSTLLISKDPTGLHGYRAAVWYQPDRFIWQHLSIYFDASVGHWWVNTNDPNRNINIISTAPYLRYYFVKQVFFSPFVEASIGLAYLSRSRMVDRNLGMHFAFQDQLGVGATFGKTQQLSVSATTMHYSNGSLCKANAGITIPLLLSIGYHF